MQMFLRELLVKLTQNGRITITFSLTPIPVHYIISLIAFTEPQKFARMDFTCVIKTHVNFYYCSSDTN